MKRKILCNGLARVEMKKRAPLSLFSLRESQLKRENTAEQEEHDARRRVQDGSKKNPHARHHGSVLVLQTHLCSAAGPSLEGWARSKLDFQLYHSYHLLNVRFIYLILFKDDIGPLS